ncbi:MAG: antitoxin family protein [Anaerolineae bacterium]|nr:antitoxin family protein [Anaerolineae bacterium]
MTITTTATYENGTLRLSHPLDLPEHTRVEIQIQPAVQVEPVRPALFSPDEQARRVQVVQRLRGLWSAQDQVAFEQTRRELWAQWQSRDLA